MKRLTLIALFAAAFACSAVGTEHEIAPWTPADVAGRYGQSGHIGYLELDPDGTYECFVLNGITAEGCATFQGAGMSQGYWVLEGGSVSFEPLAEPLDLIIKLSEASAVPRATGLALTIDGTHHLLARSDAQGEQPDR